MKTLFGESVARVSVATLYKYLPALVAHFRIAEIRLRATKDRTLTFQHACGLSRKVENLTVVVVDHADIELYRIVNGATLTIGDAE